MICNINEIQFLKNCTRCFTDGVQTRKIRKTKILFSNSSRIVKLILCFLTDNVCSECVKVTVSISSSQGDIFLRVASGLRGKSAINYQDRLVVVNNTVASDILTGERTNPCSMLSFGIRGFRFK